MIQVSLAGPDRIVMSKKHHSLCMKPFQFYEFLWIYQYVNCHCNCIKTKSESTSTGMFPSMNKASVLSKFHLAKQKKPIQMDINGRSTSSTWMFASYFWRKMAIFTVRWYILNSTVTGRYIAFFMLQLVLFSDTLWNWNRGINNEPSCTCTWHLKIIHHNQFIWTKFLLGGKYTHNDCIVSAFSSPKSFLFKVWESDYLLQNPTLAIYNVSSSISTTQKTIIIILLNYTVSNV